MLIGSTRLLQLVVVSLGVFLIGGRTALCAQGTQEPEIPVNRPVDRAEWERATGNLDFSREQPREREVSNDQWDRASKNLDYSDDRPRERQRRDEKPGKTRTPATGMDWTAFTSWFGVGAQIVAILIAVGLIGYAVYRMLKQPRNRTINRAGVEITLDNLDEHLQETDLDRFLRDALAQKNYGLAIRLYYLQIIKDLSAAGHIRWARDKTNRDYQMEMQSHVLYADFRDHTATYEKVWYGNARVSEKGFQDMAPAFQQFIQRIRNKSL